MRIGDTFTLPAFPNNLPDIRELQIAEGIFYFDKEKNLKGKVFWKEDGLLKTIHYNLSSFKYPNQPEAIGQFKQMGIDADGDEIFLHQGEWLELDKKMKVKRITIYDENGKATSSITKVGNNVYLREYKNHAIIDTQIITFKEYKELNY